MKYKNVTIFGGCGFVGSNLSVMLSEHDSRLRITAVDNLRRRGSDLNIPRLQQFGIEFVHASVCDSHAIEELGDCDLVIHCAAEASVQSGVDESPRRVLDTNIGGTINALEYARKRKAAFLFISSSRVYSIDRVNSLPFEEEESRFRWKTPENVVGCSKEGISEDFSLEGVRSFYGTSKLACEFLISEYVANFNLRALVNRCGVLTGPWQFAKANQGVVGLWVSRHFFELPLTYIGYGGTGKQVRDILHIRDLVGLITKQIMAPEDMWDGRVYNVGGGEACSTSLLELTETCRSVTKKTIPIGADPKTSSVDVRCLLMDATKAKSDFQWAPSYGVSEIVADITEWISTNEVRLRPLFCG